MGNPLGLTGSVTEGIISATGRTVTEPSGGSAPGATLPEAIQTSASINPGNSGGALVDLAGDVIGIPTLAALEPSEDGGGAAPAPGIGFAIPSNVVTDIAEQLVAHNGHVVNSHRAQLGVGVATVVDPTGQPVGMGVVSVGHCCFVRSGKSLDSFGGLFDQMARVSSVKAAITRRVVGSSMPSS
jgi:S1-C subfamily serine protease